MSYIVMIGSLLNCVPPVSPAGSKGRQTLERQGGRDFSAERSIFPTLRMMMLYEPVDFKKFHPEREQSKEKAKIILAVAINSAIRDGGGPDR